MTSTPARQKTEWRRFCKRCGEIFKATGKYHRICDDCSRKAILNSRIKKEEEKKHGKIINEYPNQKRDR